MKKRYFTLLTLLFFNSTSFAQWAVDANNVNASNTNTGNIGIGTTSPIGKLDIRGQTFIGTNDLVLGSAGSFVQIDQAAANGNTYTQIRAFSNGGNTSSDLILQSAGGRVGIGTSNPTEKLDVAGNMLLRNMSNAPGSGSSISFSSYDSAHPGPKIRSYLDNAEGPKSQSRLILSSYGLGAYNNELTLYNGNVGVGTITPKERLSVNGSIRATEIKVESENWPDYVFKPSYKLASLNEVKAYINKNQHLSGIPSKIEIAEKGLSLGEMNKLLMKKVEELTLYLIQKDGQLSQQAAQIIAVNAKLELLNRRIRKIER
jgi:hypothetical protein